MQLGHHDMYGIGALSILETTNLQIIDSYFSYSSLWGTFIGGVFLF